MRAILVDHKSLTNGDGAHTAPKPRAEIENPRMLVTVIRGDEKFAVFLSAYREFNRIHRMARMALRISTYALYRISELHDHKGTLSVVWREMPDSAAVADVHTAWADECECQVDHFHDGQPILESCCDTPPTDHPILEGPRYFPKTTKAEGDA